MTIINSIVYYFQHCLLWWLLVLVLLLCWSFSITAVHAPHEWASWVCVWFVYVLVCLLLWLVCLLLCMCLVFVCLLLCMFLVFVCLVFVCLLLCMFLVFGLFMCLYVLLRSRHAACCVLVCVFVLLINKVNVFKYHVLLCSNVTFYAEISWLCEMSVMSIDRAPCGTARAA